MNAKLTRLADARFPVTTLPRNPAARLTLAALCLGLTLCARASATVIDTYPDWDGSVTQSYLKVAQSFVAPTDNLLSSWRFTLAPIAAPTNVLFQIVRWNTGSGPTGAPLYSRQLSWPTSGGDVLVDHINLTLTPGTRYAAVVDLEGYSGNSLEFQYNRTNYDQGSASWFGGLFNPSWEYLDSPYNTAFRAEFAAIPEPSHLLALGLLVTSLLQQRMRSQRARFTAQQHET